MIPYGKHKILSSDIKAVNKALTSEFITQGPLVNSFEESICNYTGAKHSIAVNSATSGLHLACLSLGLKEGDYLWTTAISFVASANCALYCGAKVDFIDIDAQTNNISIVDLEKKLIKAKAEKKIPKIIVVVHLSGLTCDMKRIRKLSKKYKFKVIEDASHAIGSSYSKNNMVGSCMFSEITVFSFHPVKIITTGEGGLCCTNNEKIAKKINQLRSHGVIRNPENRKNLKDELWGYEQQYLGFNYRMNDIQAALGKSQLKRINTIVKKRNSIAKHYNKSLKDAPIQLPILGSNSVSSFHLYIIKLDDSHSKLRNSLYEHLHKKDIGVNLHYIPIYKHNYYKKLGFPKNYCPEAERYFKSAISLPIYPELARSDINYISDTINSFFAK